MIVDAAPSSTDPACSTVLTALPDQLGELTRRETTSQATAAWSDDQGTTVRLRCGADEPAPTTDPCTVVGGVDWITDSPTPDEVRLRTFGRSPTVEIIFPADHQDGTDVALSSVSTVAKDFPQDRTCT